MDGLDFDNLGIAVQPNADRFIVEMDDRPLWFSGVVAVREPALNYFNGIVSAPDGIV